MSWCPVQLYNISEYLTSQADLSFYKNDVMCLKLIFLNIILYKKYKYYLSIFQFSLIKKLLTQNSAAYRKEVDELINASDENYLDNEDSPKDWSEFGMQYNLLKKNL